MSRKSWISFLLVLTGLLYFMFIHGQEAVQKEDLSQVWPAKWIISQEGPWKAYAVHRFRKEFTLEELPDKLVVHTSGDMRYRFYVNGVLVNWGPQRGDLDHWFYESCDIAAYLKVGENILAAEVLNYGSHPPDPQLSVQSAFLLASDQRSFRFLNTGKSWKAIHDPSYSPALVDRSQMKGYYGGGSREVVDGRRYLWDWQLAGYDDESWKGASEIENAFAKTCIWASRWKLTPSSLPKEELIPQQFQTIRLVEGISMPVDLPVNEAMLIPPGIKARIIFDQGFETTAYPFLQLRGGKDASVTLRYVEAPVLETSAGRMKGNRNQIEGKSFLGYFDRYIAEGSDKQVYIPFWWRAFRYIEMSIETFDEELVIEDFYSIYSGYPFEQKASIELGGLPETSMDTLDQIMDVGERTVRLCAHETFMDCPYYEESQFPGDTRIQALVSYTNFGDARLGKNAIDQFSWSLNDEGFLSARYPTNSTYYIPNYNIYWIGMLYDYMMYVGNRDFIATKLPVMRYILDYFLRRERADGSIGKPDYHNFVDWTFKKGEGPFDASGYSALVDLHLLMALQWAGELEAYAGTPANMKLYEEKAKGLSQVIRDLYYDQDLELFKDTPEGKQISVHTNHLAILTGTASPEESKMIMKRILVDEQPGMTGPSIYWQFYQYEALQKSGLKLSYLDCLGTWKEMLRAGVTTWPETGLESRSECHGWGASPNYHLLSLVAGIQPAAPGFKKIRIEPRPGKATSLHCSHPHPAGSIDLNLQFNKNSISGEVNLPAACEGLLIWKGNEILLSQGLNKIEK